MGPCGSKQAPPQMPSIHFASPAGDNVMAGDDSVRHSPSATPSSQRPRGECRKDTINSAKFILSNQGKITDAYTMDEKKLGEGTFGSVAKGVHRVTKTVRAIKTISKANMKNIEKFRREIEIMKLMDHPNIVKLFETMEDSRNIYLAMELCTGGELFDRIIEAGTLSERDAAVVVQQILRAINYMHDKQVAHRDLKPENFLFLTKDDLDKSVLKIIDFGLSCFFKPGQAMSTRAGTPYYVAPQVLAGRYDQSCDLWSVGVIMYILLCGYPPFHGRNDQEVLAKVRRGRYAFDEKEWGRVSSDAKHLIQMLLHQNPRERFSAQQGLNHRWIRHTAPKASATALTSNPALVDNLRGFRTQNKLKKAALQIIASQLDDSQLRGLRDAFTALDSNGDGLLTVAELKTGLDKAGFRKTNSDLEEMCDGIDTDGSGVIDYTEFIAAALDKRSYLSEKACWTAFKVFDLDGDGKISVEELRTLLEDESHTESMGAERAAELLRDVDRNGDGQIDFQEFMAMMNGGMTVATRDNRRKRSGFRGGA
uniref:Calcium-dependent protein kinase 1 n=1 Tax=Zooxanthella nutricula TaxID=1333877 RepID=A0A7S2HL28_9DINO